MLQAQGATPAPAPVVAVAPPPSSPLTAVRARVLAGDPATALALIAQLAAPEKDSSAVRYLAARLHEQRAQLPQALASLPTDLSSLPEAVKKDSLERRALWLAKTGKCKEAMPQLLARVKEARDISLRLSAIECALSAFDVASALSLLAEAPASAEKSFSLRFLRARALARSGDRPAAIRALRELYVQKPEHGRIEDVLRELKKLVPKVKWSDTDRLDRASALIDALRPTVAIAELDLLHAPKAKAHRARALHLRGMALFQMRTRYPEAAKVLGQAAAISGEYQASDAYHAARALARADRDAEAVKAYRVFAKRFPDSQFVNDALHAAAWLELRHEFAGGEANMRSYLAEVEKKADQDAMQNALWELAVYLFDHGTFDKAQPLFERYAETSQAAMIRGRGFYWAGRAALLAGDKARAITHYQAALGVEPLHWYAQLARARLVALGQSVPDPYDAASLADAQAALSQARPLVIAPAPSAQLPAPAPGPVQAPALLALPLPDEVTFYAQLGLYPDALEALRRREDSLRASAPAGMGLHAIIATYRQLEEYARPYLLVERERNDVLRARPSPSNQTLWEALFPRPYALLVKDVAAKERLPEEFIYSIMRKESAYNPTVVSSADAVGLLQLIEPTAKTMARMCSINGFKRAQLFDPAINIRLGARYLGFLRDRYRGQYVPAIAAYNAGEHRIGQWLSRAAQRDPNKIELDRWVEDIPIEQTRNYVRRVIANWARYRYLENPAQPWPIDLPELLTK